MADIDKITSLLHSTNASLCRLIDLFEDIAGSVDFLLVSDDTPLSVTQGGFWIFNGTSATWSLPAASPSHIGRTITIKNRGTAGLTINITGGASIIYETTPVSSVIIPSGEARTFVFDGTYWVIV